MPRRALQVIGDRPMVLVAKPILGQPRDQRADAAQLRVSESVARSRLGEQLALGILQPFGNADAAVAELFYLGVDLGEERSLVESDFREQQHQRYRRLLVVGQAHRRGDPAGVPPHDLQHEDPRRGLRHRRHVERGLAHRGRDVFRD